MNEPVSGNDPAGPAVWQRLVREVFAVRLDAAAAAAAAGGVARALPLLATDAPGALFDTEPSHHARTLTQGVPR
jgi:hypothetical protein